MTGVPIASRPQASIGRRVAGYLLDQLPLLLVSGVVLFLVTDAVWAGSFGEALVPLAGWAVASFGYGIFLLWWVATAGLTPGKRLLGLRVVSDRSGRPIGWGPAFIRQLVLGLVVGLTLGIGGLVLAAVAARSPRRQGWHDRAAGSVVVDERAAVAPAAQAPAAPRPAPGIVSVVLPAGAVPAAAAPARPPAPAGAEPPPTPRPAPSPAGTGLVSAVPGLVDDVPGIGPSAPPADDDDPELTRMPARRAPAGWALDVGGRRLVVEGTGLLGRDPEPRAGEDVAHLVPVDDPQRSLSKTHLQFGVDEHGFWVRDRGSTNGTAVRTPNGARQPCPPGTTVQVSAGSTLLLGDSEVRVSRT